MLCYSSSIALSLDNLRSAISFVSYSFFNSYLRAEMLGLVLASFFGDLMHCLSREHSFENSRQLLVLAFAPLYTLFRPAGLTSPFLTRMWSSVCQCPDLRCFHIPLYIYIIESSSVQTLIIEMRVTQVCNVVYANRTCAMKKKNKLRLTQSIL